LFTIFDSQIKSLPLRFTAFDSQNQNSLLFDSSCLLLYQFLRFSSIFNSLILVRPFPIVRFIISFFNSQNQTTHSFSSCGFIYSSIQFRPFISPSTISFRQHFFHSVPVTLQKLQFTSLRSIQPILLCFSPGIFQEYFFKLLFPIINFLLFFSFPICYLWCY
jgi:hypothetical protein